MWGGGGGLGDCEIFKLKKSTCDLHYVVVLLNNLECCIVK